VGGTPHRGPRKRAHEPSGERAALLLLTGGGGRGGEPGEIVERILRGADYDRGRDLLHVFCFFERIADDGSK